MSKLRFYLTSQQKQDIITLYNHIIFHGERILLSYFSKHFFPQDNKLFVTEFGHSVIEKSKKVGPRSREIYILHFVTKGYCEFSGFTVKEGQAFLISRGFAHSFTTSDDYEHFWIGFYGTETEYVFNVFNLEVKPHQLFRVENSEFAKVLFFNAEQKLNSDDVKAPDTVAFAVLMTLLPLLKTDNYTEADREVNYAEKVQLLIRTNYAHPIKMTEIAKEIHITEKYMYRLFLNKFGISPQRYLLKTRMDVAKKLLIERNLSVMEAAYSVGYSSLPSFSKAFSNYFGISPGLLKKQNAHL